MMLASVPMPTITSTDAPDCITKSRRRHAGVFVHESPGLPHLEPQMRHFARAHRCVTFSRAAIRLRRASEASHYGQDIARGT